VEDVIEVRLGTQGRIVLPRELRDQLAAEEGAVYAARVVGGTLVLEPRDVVLQRLRERVRGTAASGESVVDELIAERRSQAAAE